MKRKGNLSEELYKMRKLMSFNSEKFRDETTSLDRLVEEKMMEKYLLNEQEVNGDPVVRQNFEDKGTELLKASDEEKSLFSRGCNINYGQGDLSDEEIKLTNDRREELNEKYGDTYNKFLTALSNYPGNTNNCKYWFKDLLQESRYSFIDGFVLWVDENKNAKKLFGQPNLEVKNESITAKIVKGSPNPSEIIKIEGEIPPPTIDPFRFNMKGKDTFIDNCSDITEGIRSKIDAFIEMVTPRIEDVLSQPNGKVVCEKIDVATSSSRFRNSDKGECDASKLTWGDLSKERGTKVYEEIYRRLSELGVTFTNKHKVLRGSERKDGTSGPNPGTNESGIQNTISVDGTYRNIINNPTPKEIDKYGTPHTTKEEYENYKFCTVEVLISDLSERPPTPYNDVEVIKSRNYSIVFNIKHKLGGSVKTRKFNLLKWITPNEGVVSNSKCMIW